MESLEELSQFLKPNQRIDLKAVSLTYVLGLTGTSEGKSCLFNLTEIVESVILLTQDVTKTIAKDALLTLINLTAEESGAIKLLEICKTLEPEFEIISRAVDAITDRNCDNADPWTMVLSNITRVESLVSNILEKLESKDDTILKLVKAFTQNDYNTKQGKLHYLGPIFCNLTQTPRGREIFCTSKHNFMEKIIPFASFKESVIRRGGTIGILKNICFDSVYHDFILNEKDDILYCLLYPLIGPEEFSDEENDKFPIELQYMSEVKTREEDGDLRIMLLECILQLCATRKHREFLRSKGTYEILREYHKWEANIGEDKKAWLVCENIIDILIKKEEEIGVDNYREVEVPSEITEKFFEEDAKILAE